MNILRECPDWSLNYKILQYLSNGNLSINELTNRLNSDLKTISKTMQRLSKIGMIEPKSTMQNSTAYFWGVTELFKIINK
jgi:predicted transcriptional regulator